MLESRTEISGSAGGGETSRDEEPGRFLRLPLSQPGCGTLLSAFLALPHNLAGHLQESNGAPCLGWWFVGPLKSPAGDPVWAGQRQRSSGDRLTLVLGRCQVRSGLPGLALSYTCNGLFQSFYPTREAPELLLKQELVSHQAPSLGEQVCVLAQLWWHRDGSRSWRGGRAELNLCPFLAGSL